MNFLTVKQRNTLMPIGTRRFELRSKVMSRARRVQRRVLFRVGVGPRWFVRCRCGHRATQRFSTNVGRPNVYTRWFCDRCRAGFDDAERRAGRRW